MIVSREMIKKDLKSVQHAQETTSKTYFQLASSFGYSLTEREMDVEESSESQPTEVVVTKHDDIVALIKITPKEDRSLTADVQIALIGDNYAKDIVCEELSFLLQHYASHENITRFTSFIFEDDVDERDLLVACGFDQEGVFDEHIYFRGTYRNLFVYGTRRGG